MTPTQPRWWQRVALRFAFTRIGSWLFSRTLHYVDLCLMGVSGGRLSVPRVFGGVPVVRLTTTGAKTGKDRTVPVLGIRDGERWILVASNWGSEEHPAWYYNLKANPEVTLTYNDQSGRFVAREATEEDRENYWRRARKLYPGFDRYQERSGERRIPTVVLTPSGREGP